VKLERVDGAQNQTGARVRRLWSAEEKRKIVAEAMEPGASMAEVARRYEVNPNLLFTWRRQTRAKSDAASVELIPIVVTPETAAPASRIEIVLVGGERIIVGPDVDATALTRIIKALNRL
jgi:transposase